MCADLFSVAGTAANALNEVAGHRTRTGGAENGSADAEWGDFGGTDDTQFGTEDFGLASAPGFKIKEDSVQGTDRRREERSHIHRVHAHSHCS
jgi:hypothetical protein